QLERQNSPSIHLGLCLPHSHDPSLALCVCVPLCHWLPITQSPLLIIPFDDRGSSSRATFGGVTVAAVKLWPISKFGAINSRSEVSVHTVLLLLSHLMQGILQ